MASRPLEPLGLFTYGALKAGWYFFWRMTLFTVAFWGGGLLVAAGAAYLGQDNPALLLVAAGVAVAGFLGAFIASIPLTNRIARGWSLAFFGRPLAAGIWWGFFWRVLVVSLVAGFVFSVVQVATTIYAARMEWSPTQLFVTMIPYAVLIANLVILLRSYGWAMSVMVVRRLRGERARASSAATGGAGVR